MSKSLARATIWVTVSEIIFNVTSFLVHTVVGRILGPSDYGRFGIIITLTTMVIILIGNGIPTAMSKYISEVFESDPRLVRVIKRQAILIQTGIIGVVTLAFFISAPLIAKVLGDPTLTPLFRLSTLIIPTFAAASFYFSFYTGLHRFGIQSLLKISRSSFRVIFIIGLAYFFGVRGSVMGYIAAPLSVFLLAYFIDRFYVSKKLQIDAETQKNIASLPKPEFDWHKLVNYAWQIVLFFLAYELLISIDLYLVKGILRNDHLTGIYNASLSLGRMPYFLFYSLTVVLLPAISKSTAQKDDARTSRLISQSLRTMLILLVPVVILMSAFAQPIIKLFFSDRYIEAAYPMSILVWGVGFLTIYYVLCFVMNGAGKVKTPMVLSIAGLALNTVLNYFFIKTYGIVGSAIATSITSAIITFFMLYHTRRDFGVSVGLKSLSKIMLAGIIIYAAALRLDGGTFAFIPWSAFLSAIYMLILLLMKEISNDDINEFKRMFKRDKNNKQKNQ